MVVALIALFIALGGPASAAHLIDGATIKSNSITNKQIRNGTLGTQDLSKTALKRLATIPANAITARQIAPKSIDATKMADGLLGAAGLAPNSIDATKLADGLIGSTQLGMGAVTPSKIADGAVGGLAIADGSLQTSDLGDFSGSVSVQFDPFLPNTCQVATFNPQPSSAASNPAIGDDVVSVSPGTGWPDPIMVSGNPGAGNTLRIVACRIGQDPAKEAGDPTDTIPVARTTFQYVAFDAP